jgi:cation transport ATPase
MRIFFSFLFLAIASILSALQAYLFAYYRNFDWWRSLLLACMTIGCVIGATMIFKESKESNLRKIVSGCATVVCLGLISRIAYFLLAEGGYTSGWEYVVLSAYTLSFGIYAYNGFES